MTIARQVYVISDLHIGGTYPAAASAADVHPQRRRGFRMMTRVKELAGFIDHLSRLPDAPPVELVINGDFIDFLAEEKRQKTEDGFAVDPKLPPAWTPFRSGRGEALDTFRDLVARDKPLFTALRGFLAAGKRLTLVLGNHDIELCLPDVRAALEEELGPGRLRFLDDGQALDLGEVLVDHGNLFDPANVVDHDQLRVVRALYSRGWYDGLGKLFKPPAGSRLVAEVMNPIKVAYGFVDLLKPESEPLLALLLAFEPSYRSKLEATATSLAGAARTLVPRLGVPYTMRNVADEYTGKSTPTLTDVAGGGAERASALDDLVAELLASDAEAAAAAQSLQAAGREGAAAVEVAGGTWRARWSLIRMLTGDDDGEDDTPAEREARIATRVAEVQATLRVLERDQSFDRGAESPRYLDAAQWLATRGDNQKGYRAVVFGHTHHAKDLLIPKTKIRYFNTGTWANLMKFPDVFTRKGASHDEVKTALFAFAKKLQTNDLDDYLVFDPTYVRLDLDADGALLDAALRPYDHAQDKL